MGTKQNFKTILIPNFSHFILKDNVTKAGIGIVLRLSRCFVPHNKGHSQSKLGREDFSKWYILARFLKRRLLWNSIRPLHGLVIANANKRQKTEVHAYKMTYRVNIVYLGPHKYSTISASLTRLLCAYLCFFPRLLAILNI